jgi:O-antigen/teichoic acid export membrane protein
MKGTFPINRDVIIYYIGKTVPALVNFAVIVFTVRFLGQEEYGKYSLVLYAVMLTVMVTFGWVQQSITRFLSIHKDDPAPVLNKFYYLTLLSALAALLLMFVVCLFYFHLSLYETAVILVCTFLYTLFTFHLNVNMALMKSVRYAVIEGSYNIAFLLVLLVLIGFSGSRSFLLVFIGMAIGLAASETVRLWILPGGRHGLEIKKIRPDIPYIKTVMNYGLYMSLFLCLSYLVTISDRYIVKEYAGYSGVGAYAAIKDLTVKISTFTIMPILLAYGPKIFDCWNHDKTHEAMQHLRKALKLVFLFLVVVTVAYIAGMDFLYSKLLHLRTKGLFVPSVLLVLSAFIWQAALFLHKPLELVFRQRTIILVIFCCLAANITSNLLLVPVFGFRAAAFVSFFTAVAYASAAAFLSFLVLKKRKYATHR